MKRLIIKKIGIIIYDLEVEHLDITSYTEEVEITFTTNTVIGVQLRIPRDMDIIIEVEV